MAPSPTGLSRADLVTWLDQELVGDTSTLSDEELLFSSGRLDSLVLIDLVRFIEERTGQRVAWNEVNLNNLDSIGRIMAYVASKRA